MNQVIIICAKYLFIFVILGIVIAWLCVHGKTKKQFLVTIILAGIISYALSRLAGHIYFDPRPFVTEHITPLIPHAADNGFPSDHALFTMTLTVAAFFFSKKIAAGMLLLTIAVGVARVLAHVHSPIDIAGGWLIGAAGAIVSYFLVRWLFGKYYKKQVVVTAKNEQ